MERMDHPSEVDLPTREMFEAYEELYDAARALADHPKQPLLLAGFQDALAKYDRLRNDYRELQRLVQYAEARGFRHYSAEDCEIHPALEEACEGAEADE